jgi:hypothetical protein
VKKVVSLGLILLLSLQCFYKLGMISYFQLNRDYIAEVLCINKEKPLSKCHGQCFLKRKLNLADETPKAPAPVSKVKGEIIFFLVSPCYRLGQQALLQPLEMNSAYHKIYSFDYSSSTFHPPQLA